MKLHMKIQKIKMKDHENSFHITTKGI